MLIIKTFFLSNPEGEIISALKQLIPIKDNPLPFNEIVKADMLKELVSLLADEATPGETDQDRLDHLEETLFINKNEDIIVYDSSPKLVIHYLKIDSL